MKKKMGYEYELNIVNLDPGGGRVKIKSMGLSSDSSYSSHTGLQFCGLGFCNITFKGYIKQKKASMAINRHVKYA